MKNVGESESRNRVFEEKYTRGKLLKDIVGEGRMVIFDVGAHIGQSIVYLKELFPESEMLSFEPDPDSFAKLSAEKVPGVRYFNLALSDKDGESTFYRNRISHTNSLLRVNANSRDSIALSKAKEEEKRELLSHLNHGITVRTARLDSFCRHEDIAEIDLLKIDVQGAETAVISGSISMLDRTRVIVVEVSFFDYYEKSSSFLEIEQLLAPAGFRLFSISEISNNPMNGRTDWAEVIYSRAGSKPNVK